MIKAEVSLFPVNSEELGTLTGLSGKFLDEHGLDHHSYLASTSLNTTISGDSAQVWEALRHLFQQNRPRGHDAVMVVTLIHCE